MEQADIPKFQLSLKKNFMDILSQQVCLFQHKPIRGENNQGLNDHGLLEGSQGGADNDREDLQSMGCVLFYKGCQELETETETEKVFLGVPNTIE